MDAEWHHTADGAYYRYVKQSIDRFVTADGLIASGEAHEEARDNVLLGRQLLLLYDVTQNQRYYQAAQRLQQQLVTHPASATPISPEDLYRTEPFFAEYAAEFEEPQDFAGITRNFMLAEQHVREAKTGDSARDLTWTLMALVDTLPYYPEHDPGRAPLLSLLHRTAAAAMRHENLDKPEARDNDFDSSAACRLTYALARGVRLGYLPRSYEAYAERAWRNIQISFAKADSDAPEGVGAFLLAASEMEMDSAATAGLGDTVLLDAWYNSQKRKNAAGQNVLYHYKWDDESNSGFSFFGHILRSYGIVTKTLTSAPTAEKLRGAQFYIIVSPDNPAKNSDPHFMTAQDAQQIAAWARRGGVLLMMENDPPNADIAHMDLLADLFGLHFNNVLVHHVIGDNFAMGRIDLPTASPPFTHPHVLYMKDTCSLTLSQGAQPLLRYQGDLLMAMAKAGKGMVFAVTDPWLYNEYTDGRKLPVEFDNFAAGRELTAWLLQQRARLPR